MRELLEGLSCSERTAFDVEIAEFEIFDHFGGGAGETNQIKDEKGFVGTRSGRLHIPERELERVRRLLAEIFPIETKIGAHGGLGIFFAFIDDLAEVANDASNAQRGTAGLFGNRRKNARPSRRNDEGRIVEVDFADAPSGEIVQRKDDAATLQAGEFLSRLRVVDDKVRKRDLAGACHLNRLHIDARVGQVFFKGPTRQRGKVPREDKDAGARSQNQKDENRPQQAEDATLNRLFQNAICRSVAAYFLRLRATSSNSSTMPSSTRRSTSFHLFSER